MSNRGAIQKKCKSKCRKKNSKQQGKNKKKNTRNNKKMERIRSWWREDFSKLVIYGEREPLCTEFANAY